METLKMNPNRVQTQFSLSGDPRIDSPQIKVVYPAPPVVLKYLPEQTATPPQTAPPETVVPLQQVTPTEQQENTPPSTPTAQSWQETIKQNAMLFIIVGLLALGAGFLLGKNKG